MTETVSCEDFLQFAAILKFSRTLFAPLFPFILFVNSSFLKAFTCLIQNNLTNIFKTTRHEQNKENKFLVMSPMSLYSHRSCRATTNHSTRSIHIIV